MPMYYDFEEQLEIKDNKIDLSHIGSYDIILADPPWEYTGRAIGSDHVGQVENHYNTLSYDEIKQIILPAKKDSMLFLWATSPLLDIAMDTLKTWGYTYKSSAIWEKTVSFTRGVPLGANGMGFYFRINHEILLVGKKGDFKCPTPGNRVGSVFKAKVRSHSQKPDIIYSIIDQMYPEANKIELFARRRREGWDAWGNESDNNYQTVLVSSEKKLLSEG